MFAKKVFANKGAVLGFEGLVFAINRFVHARFEEAVGIAHEKWIPVRSPYHLDHVPAGTAELSFEFLDNFSVSPHWTIQPLKIAVDDEDQIVQSFPAGEADRTHGFRFIHFAITDEGPYLPLAGVSKPAVMEITEKTSLVNSLYRPETH